jgi:UDP-N-acetylmuramyl pentapeptide phosphotransferase/UDP-N-acetylglucosamine-1-phosphate transferase
LEPYVNPLWDFSNGSKERKKEEKIVAYLNCFAGRTHFARTNFFIVNILIVMVLILLINGIDGIDGIDGIGRIASIASFSAFSSFLTRHSLIRRPQLNSDSLRTLPNQIF